MGMREKDQADFDLETFVDLFDTAMSSDNPAVKKALKNLILISALVDAKSEHEIRIGPLRRLVEDIKHLNQRLQALEYEKSYKTTYVGTTPPGIQTSPGTGTWPPGGYQAWPQTNPNTIAPSAVPGTSLPPGTMWTSAAGSVNVASSKDSGIKSFVDGHGDVFEVKIGSLLDKLESK